MSAFRNIIQRNFSSQAIASLPKPPLPVQYHEKIGKALFNANDPRTYPRVAVTATAAAFFSLMSATFVGNRRHHFDPQVKNSVMSRERMERPVQVTRTLSNGPILMNASRYETLKKGTGLGVDHEEWKLAKKLSNKLDIEQ